MRKRRGARSPDSASRRGAEHFGYLITMDVLPRYRRKGVAAALLAEAERRLAERDVREVWLETATDNEAAIAFWLEARIS